MPYKVPDNMDDICQPVWLSSELNAGRSPLLLDCRSPNEYNKSHIRGSIHVAIPSLMLRRLKKGNLSVASVIGCNESKERFNKKWKSETVVLYDDNTTDLNANPTSIVNLLLRKLREDGCHVCLLEGGFSQFAQKNPQLCSRNSDTEESTILGLRNLRISENSEPEDTLSPTTAYPFPVEVIDYLFLGNAKNAGDLSCLEKNNIRYILNVTPNVPNQFEHQGQFKYMQIPISDHWSQNLSVFFEDAIRFIDEARSQRVGILVHCLAGISRSVTVTVAYLMSSFSLSLNEAYDKVKECKPNISPNFNFMGQLLDLEKKLGSPGKCNCDCNKDLPNSGSSTSSSSSYGSSISSSSSSSDGLGGRCHCCDCFTPFFTTPTKSSPNFALEVNPS